MFTRVFLQIKSNKLFSHLERVHLANGIDHFTGRGEVTVIKFQMIELAKMAAIMTVRV